MAHRIIVMVICAVHLGERLLDSVRGHVSLRPHQVVVRLLHRVLLLLPLPRVRGRNLGDPVVAGQRLPCRSHHPVIRPCVGRHAPLLLLLGPPGCHLLLELVQVVLRRRVVRGDQKVHLLGSRSGQVQRFPARSPLGPKRTAPILMNPTGAA